MRILMSNDDGYFSQGINVLFDELKKIAEVVVVAPDTEKSGASNSLTLDRPLIVKQAPNGFYHVNGTPTDCVHMAVTGLLEQVPDIIVSGINHGANMGDDTVYSGTVAAATEGFLLGIPAIAVSLVSESGGGNYLTAAQVVTQLVKQIQTQGLTEPTLLNVNVPDCPFEELKGFKVTRLGKRHKAEPVIKATNPRGQTVYWVGAAGPAADCGDGTDFDAIKQGFVSITPLQMDLTHYQQLDKVRSWLSL
ncbi:5'/3'-nucleotidase SurE [Ferrovum sp. PN-J185]|uniref:5'/3'-nucleotidase SurE n=1 Tax=Ferrovum sp. PN-J185 TaxID=1356306 RepID=UPI00079418A0|nr:5'/3'-nucleotidase SurE [Ferrovum sp. PN-J185]KXW56694.1 5'-nucleotidase SurE [Ferrovum sp. PN-J185]MCC6067620.1 5'/3'-nucleotidase SurE [Ferrovum sp. PN-J185]MDE1892019.1 5'/3'-nucleotidase SurE [Betaproteobacteria bacterium]MDE2056532.1 5'/3'-nucleotidase SurE [Betaproteobacteria bacterium]